MHRSRPSGSVSDPSAQMAFREAAFAPVLQQNGGNPFNPSYQSGVPEEDSMSVCSDKCSQKTCSDCCEGEECTEECPKSCGGFIDCDDTEACTRPDCEEVECRDISPPCFNTSCLQGLTDEDVAAAQNLATSFLSWPPPQMERPESSVPSFFGDGPNFSAWEAEDSLRQHHPLYPSADAVTAAGIDTYADSAFSYSSTTGRHQRMVTDDQLPSQFMSGSSQMDMEGSAHAFHCQWGTGCDGEFFDWSALDAHIYRTHIKPQTEVQCMWDNCLQPTDPNEIIVHVKNNHPTAGEMQTCHWSECSSTFPGPGGLENHVRSTHVPTAPLHCEWDSCGATAEGPADLSVHLQLNHFPDPLPTSVVPPGNAKASESQICRWMVVDPTGDEGGEKACGLGFADASALQQHIKEMHTMDLTKKMGYICQWADCSRRGIQPFGQKGKLERHIQVHTGCELLFSSLSPYLCLWMLILLVKSCRCTICGKDFSGPLALQQHERRHTGERPYECEMCGKRFAQGTALSGFTRYRQSLGL